MKKSALFVLPLLMVVSFSCVSNGKYNELEYQYSRLEEEKQKSALFHTQLDEIRKINADLERENTDLKNDHEELEALKESLLDPDRQEEETELSSSEIEAYLKEKKICLIGGHENWIKKLRQIFPDWRYIRPNIFQMKDVSELKKYDCVFMFTDHLDHRTYQRFMAVVREAHLPIGYVTSVNLDRGMRQIYQTMKKMEEKQ